MTTQQAISKCNKKAWQEIKTIHHANNMMEVEQSISDAVEKTFGMWNKGLLLVRMKKLGQMGELEGERLIRMRRVNFDRHLSTVRNYLQDMIPTRFFNTIMYRRFIGQLPQSNS